MDIDDIIIKTFSENQNICFPIYCQREAKTFVKILFKNGLNGVIFSQEIGESETNFTSWKNGLSKLGVGKKVMRRINKPIENFLWSDGELSDLEREVKAEIEKIKSLKYRKTKINRRIELGRSPTSKTASEKVFKKEKRMKLQPIGAHSFSSDDSKVFLKSVSFPIRTPDHDSWSSNNEEKYLSFRNFQRVISCPGPEKENNQEFVEDFKTIKLRKTGRIDLYENDSNDYSKEQFDSANNRVATIAQDDVDDAQIENTKTSTKINDFEDNFNRKCNNDKSDETSESDTSNKGTEVAEQTSDLLLEPFPEKLVATDEVFQEADKEISQKTQEDYQEIDRITDSPVDYLYVFTDSNSCNNSPVKSHRFKIGMASCPYEELKKASEFNVDIKLVSATAVKNPQQVLERIQEELQVFLMKGRESWYYCPLTKVLQTTSEAVGWASNNSHRL